jgi:hypothetical protein
MFVEVVWSFLARRRCTTAVLYLSILLYLSTRATQDQYSGDTGSCVARVLKYSKIITNVTLTRTPPGARAKVQALGLHVQADATQVGGQRLKKRRAVRSYALYLLQYNEEQYEHMPFICYKIEYIHCISEDHNGNLPKKTKPLCVRISS